MILTLILIKNPTPSTIYILQSPRNFLVSLQILCTSNRFFKDMTLLDWEKNVLQEKAENVNLSSTRRCHYTKKCSPLFVCRTVPSNKLLQNTVGQLLKSGDWKRVSCVHCYKDL